jgi:hypothetical protein
MVEAISMTSGHSSQQLVNCPFCALPYDIKQRTAISYCDRCKFPLLPARVTPEIFEDYRSRLGNLRSQWHATDYEGKVQAQITWVEKSLEAARKKPSISPIVSRTTTANSAIGNAPSTAPSAAESVKSWFSDRLIGVEGQVQKLKDEVAKFAQEQFVLRSDLEGQIIDLKHQLLTERENRIAEQRKYEELLDKAVVNAVQQVKTEFLELLQSAPQPIAPHTSIQFQEETQTIGSEATHEAPSSASEDEPEPQTAYPQPWWIDEYQHSPDRVKPRISVCIPDSVIGDQRIGRSQQTLFEESDSDDDYWLISSDDVNYSYLVPSKRFNFNSHTTDIAAISFEFDEDDRTDFSKFSLVIPAIVEPYGSKWQLVQKGRLEFAQKSPLADDLAASNGET